MEEDNNPQLAVISVLGERRKKKGNCDHRMFDIDQEAGAVYCRTCEEEVPAFMAIVKIAKEGSLYQEKWEYMQRQKKRLQEEINDLIKWNPCLRAVRILHDIWRSKNMLPTCPHCKLGIEAADLSQTGQVSRDYNVVMIKIKNRETNANAVSLPE